MSLGAPHRATAHACLEHAAAPAGAEPLTSQQPGAWGSRAPHAARQRRPPRSSERREGAASQGRAAWNRMEDQFTRRQSSGSSVGSWTASSIKSEAADSVDEQTELPEELSDSSHGSTGAAGRDAPTETFATATGGSTMGGAAPRAWGVRGLQPPRTAATSLAWSWSGPQTSSRE